MQAVAFSKQVANDGLDIAKRRPVVRLAHDRPEPRSLIDQSPRAKRSDRFADHRPAGTALAHEVELRGQWLPVGE